MTITNTHLYWGNTLYQRRNNKLNYIIEYLLYERDFCYIHADEGIGKSTLGQQWKHNLTKGTPFLGIYPTQKPLNCLWCMGEKTKEDHYDRVDNMKRVIEIDDSKWGLYESEDTCFDIKDDMKRFANEIREPGIKWDVIFIDSLYNFVYGDLNNNTTANHWTRNVRAIAKEHESSVVVFGHVGKTSYFQQQGGGVLEINKSKSPFGAKQWGAFFNIIYELKFDNKTELHTLIRVKDNRGICIPSITMQMICPQKDKDGRLCYIAIPEGGEKMGNKQFEIIGFLQQNNGEYIYPNIYEEIGMARATFHYNVKKLLENKQVITETNEIGKVYYKLNNELSFQSNK